MGTGASNQVRSRSEPASSDVNAVLPFAGPNIQPAGNNTRFPISAINNVNNKREVLVSHKVKTFEGPTMCQKSEVRSLPSPSLHVRRNSHKTENVFNLQNRIKELELALAGSESQKLDLQDQVQVLEERCNGEDHSAASTSISDTLQEALKCKGEQITKLEEDLKVAQIEFQKKALKYKKHIRGLTKQIFELRHEMSITQMEMKAEMSQKIGVYEDQLLVTPVSSKDSMASAIERASDNHTKVIVELSTQISDQGEQIACLTAEVTQKSRHIKKLEKLLKKTKQYESIAPTATSSRNLANLDSNVISTSNGNNYIRGTFEDFSNNTMQISAFNPAINGTAELTKSTNIFQAGAHCKPDLEHQSAALSDSDWSDGPSLPPVYRHSAPAQGRTRSSQSESNSGNPRTKKVKSFPSEGECFKNPLK